MADIYVHIKISDEAIERATQALYDDRWAGDPTEGHFVSERLDDCARIARIVLHSVVENIEINAHT